MLDETAVLLPWLNMNKCILKFIVVVVRQSRFGVGACNKMAVFIVLKL